MRRERAAALAVFLALLVCGACSPDQAPAPPAPVAQLSPPAVLPTPNSIPVVPATLHADQLANYVLAEFAAVRAGQLFGEWKVNHTTGILELYDRTLPSHTGEDWCGRVGLEGRDGDHRLRLDMYFALPEPPAPISLTVGTPVELLDQCRLGLVWAEVEGGDASRVERLAAVTTQRLASDLGTGQSNLKVPWWSGASLRSTTLWRQRGLSVATAIASSLPSRSKTSQTTRLLVAAAGDASGISLERYQMPADRREEALEAFGVVTSRIDDAIRTAAVGGTAEATLRAAVDRLAAAGAPLRYPRGSDRTFILDAINTWLASAPALPALRRAAAQFAADQILGESGIGWGERENPPIRQQLEANGVQFNWAPLGGTWLYAHSLLRESLAIDPDGPIGELAFITLMERGFDTSGTCRDQPGNGFRAVIDEGTSFLARKPGSPLAPYVHLLMAQAWGDIVSLANGAAYDPAETSGYQREEAAARQRAVEEYRAAFATPTGRPAKNRQAWKDAWRLMAGLSPTSTYFYCIYD